MPIKLQWTQLLPRASASHGKPCARSSHGVSILHGGKRIVVYGGEHVARTPLPDTQALWTADFDPCAPNPWTWRHLTPSNPPPARIAHAQAVHRPSQVLYIFGGRAGIAMEEQAMNDLWKLDCSGPPGSETWSKVSPDLEAGDVPPEERSFHKMLCVGNSLYVFGGCSAHHGRLADLHEFNIETNTWKNLGVSKLRGRGGANFLPLCGGTKLGVVAGFCGEESKDGQIYDIQAKKWENDVLSTLLQDLRPRSVCVSHSFPSIGVSVVFGGEVDPSAKGHEGAGGFENDVVLLDEATAQYQSSTPASSSKEEWPETRGWSDSDGLDDGAGKGHLYIFGGLSGDDSNPHRLDDLWRLDISKV